MAHTEKKSIKILNMLIGPALSLIAFVLMYFLDPLNFSNQQPYAALPAFLISIIVLIINQNISTNSELKKTNQYSDRIYNAVRDYLHVSTIGTPEIAFSYIINRLPIIREVKNTSFNLKDFTERADEKFYDTETYNDSLKQIAHYSTKKLIWKDIGDSYAIFRFRKIENIITNSIKNKKHNYKYRLITQNEPQLNFILLEYIDGKQEVLFNWDFRGIGKDPTVLLSRDNYITEMFAIHYNHLWKSSTSDHDRNETKSTPIK